MKGGEIMSKEEFITYIIQHEADYPNTGEITLESAQTLIDNTLPEYLPKGITAEEVFAIWNRLVHDPAIMIE